MKKNLQLLLIGFGFLDGEKQCCGNISMAYDRKVTENQVSKVKAAFRKTKTNHLCTYCARCHEVFSKEKKDLQPIQFIDLIYDSE